MAGNAVIGALRVNLGIDTAQFSDGLKQAQTSADRFGKVLKTTMVAAAAAAAAALGAIALGVKNAINSADEMSKMAAKIGIPIEELSKLKYAADLSGVSLQGLQTSVGKLAKNMSDAADGTGEGKKAFDKLGIAVKGSDGKLKSASQVMAEISDKFKDMPNGAQKTAMAMQLMGRAGTDMIPLLNGGSAALNDMLKEAKDLGLEITQKTASAAEQFNDNLSRMGYAVSGLTLGLTAALAPALAVISDAMVEFVKWTLQALQYLPVLAEYVAVAGGALAVMFSPVILAAVGNLAIAIGTGLVGAVKLLTAAIAANPLGALAVAITAAVVAIYHFRDEIKQAIGIDVVAVVKDTGNMIIGTFVGAFNAIKNTWSMLPGALGDMAARGAQAVVNTFVNMGREVIVAINSMIAGINGKLRGAGFSGGIGIETIGSPQKLVPDVKIPNPWAGQASEAGGAIKTAFGNAYSTDYIGNMFKSGTSSVNDMNAALGKTGDLLDDIAGGGGGGKGKDGKVKKLKDGVKDAAREMERFVDAVAGTMTNAFQGLIDGSKTVKETLQDLLKQLASMLMNEGFKALVGGLFGGGSGGGGFLGKLFGGLFGFANGGSFQVGGAGGIDSQIVAFRASPNERVDVTKPGQERPGGAQEITIRGVFVDDNGVIKAYVTDMGQKSAQAGAQLGVRQVKQQMPGLIANAQARAL